MSLAKGVNKKDKYRIVCDHRRDKYVETLFAFMDGVKSGHITVPQTRVAERFKKLKVIGGVR